MSTLDLGGVMIPAVTPFDPVTGEVDVVGMRANIRSWLRHPIRGIVVGGSTGEAVLLDEDERHTLLEGAREVVDQGRLLVAGTGAESTRATIRLCRRAADAGVDAVLVQPPAFYRPAMTPEALATHYRHVADESPVPVIVYQVPPKFATLDLPTGLVCELSGHENVVGIKDSRGVLELVGELVDGCRAGFQVLVGNGALLYAALEVGAVGGILGVANLAPRASAAIVDAFTEGRTSEAGRLQERVGPLHKSVVGGMGVAGVKAALDALGSRGGDPRPPLRPLDEAGRGVVEEALRRAGLLQQPDGARAD
ncbi:MAG: dihydrodipicolinate synthase family protein [Gemmatimonadota bacterium]|jgi:4-hydroxy-2-oxoglutarate aldolase